MARTRGAVVPTVRFGAEWTFGSVAEFLRDYCELAGGSFAFDGGSYVAAFVAHGVHCSVKLLEGGYLCAYVHGTGNAGPRKPGFWPAGRDEYQCGFHFNELDDRPLGREARVNPYTRLDQTFKGPDFAIATVARVALSCSLIRRGRVAQARRLGEGPALRRYHAERVAAAGAA